MSYSFELTYRFTPQVRILSPKIEVSEKIHMYSSGSLCLYYPDDFKWHDGRNLHNTIIPWTAEWVVLYERFLHSGKWEGPEAPHALS